jgi:putative salt-induced outer membrane protein
MYAGGALGLSDSGDAADLLAKCPHDPSIVDTSRMFTIPSTMVRPKDSQAWPLIGALTLYLLPSVASAQSTAPLAAGLAGQQPASSGSTDVATSGFEASVVDSPEKAQDATEAKVAAGGVFTGGNSRSTAVTTAGDARLRRGRNQGTFAMAVNYASARNPDTSRMERTVENYQGKLRYDRFVSTHFAVFGALSARRDYFQGLDLRLNLDPGVAYYFLDTKPQRLWTELGYDFQYDLRDRTAVQAANATLALGATPLTRKETRHSGRLFVGYALGINERVALTTGVEYLQAPVETEFWRLNADAGLTASLAGRLSIATSVALRYDHKPLPGIERLDTMESVSLVYTLM